MHTIIRFSLLVSIMLSHIRSLNEQSENISLITSNYSLLTFKKFFFTAFKMNCDKNTNIKSKIKMLKNKFYSTNSFCFLVQRNGTSVKQCLLILLSISFYFMPYIRQKALLNPLPLNVKEWWLRDGENWPQSGVWVCIGRVAEWW